SSRTHNSAWSPSASCSARFGSPTKSRFGSGWSAGATRVRAVAVLLTGEDPRSAVPVYGLQFHRPTPHSMNVVEHSLGTLKIEAAAVVGVVVIKLQGAVHCDVLGKDGRYP